MLIAFLGVDHIFSRVYVVIVGSVEVFKLVFKAFRVRYRRKFCQHAINTVRLKSWHVSFETLLKWVSIEYNLVVPTRLLWLILLELFQIEFVLIWLAQWINHTKFRIDFLDHIYCSFLSHEVLFLLRRNWAIFVEQSLNRYSAMLLCHSFLVLQYFLCE